MAIINLPSRDPTRSAVVSVTDALAEARRELASQWMALGPDDAQRHYADRLATPIRVLTADQTSVHGSPVIIVPPPWPFCVLPEVWDAFSRKSRGKSYRALIVDRLCPSVSPLRKHGTRFQYVA